MAKTKATPAIERAADDTTATTTSATTAAAAAPAATRPVAVFRLRGVRAAVFENPAAASGATPARGEGAHHGSGGSSAVVYYKVTLQRIYRDGEEWKTTAGLARDDLPVARLLLGRAWEWILETEAAATAAARGNDARE